MPTDTSPVRPVPIRPRVLFILLLMVAVGGGVTAYERHQPPSLTDRLHEDADESVTALAEVQAKIPASEKVPRLILLTQDPSPGLRFAAVDALEAQTGAAAASAIAGAFTDSSAAVRQRALEALPHVDPVRGHRLLLQALQDEDSWLREAAATQLRLKRDRGDVPYLISAVDDADASVSNLAMGALRKQTGEPFYASVLAPPAQQRAARLQWHAWWTQNRQKFPPASSAMAPLRPLRTDPAPDFDLRDLSGGPIRLASQRGRLTLINFWGTWCPPCQQEIPDLVRLDADYRDRKLDVIGVALSESSAASLADWCRAHHVGYRQALATDPMLAAYGSIHEVPISVLIDQRGRIRYRWDGPRDYATYRAAVSRLLAEPDASPAPQQRPPSMTPAV